ncbi:FixH family protein [Candidatus Venteria ishoeyi]|uniref:FixH n=1 Tax=Candidatus Venteria ishoeyi TaxID=1899563 RepID=A0A1H6FEU2_9GAMM|nr:FixH family protein [Candidatus Venteria ishoeyi]MDM8545485.1 FixH family protein [Candidatus Venteria ishoeyi]SEH08173.1 FixH [Candidatus Venteria ishoeyi]
MSTENTQPRPWYREPYVWMIIFFPFLAVLAGSITIWIAIKSDDGLVVDDYYKRGLELNRSFARDKAASQYGIGGVLHLSPNTLKARLYLRSDASYALPEKLNLSFTHHTRTGFDQSIELTQTDKGIYDAALERDTQEIAGEWTVQLETDDWRLVGHMPASSLKLELIPEKHS